ncbi:uracil-DNA glycosylase family protein [Peptoanaerobacter stomatis]|uniref:Uracil-DNA glycosylase family protein n=1 Tax=Peptoanaerobacter stomatis TaxID=796937 RepID=J6HLN4_9FIRM|nr:uracil-DNA glycosylase family protein [Peptoanaerobacter stomatis]EJU23398.1 uracil-DNA glycosylase family protein [Peptoanaerobacter stomatis]NWO24514.1 uracil-DNA glycosylase family protein [Peptostreptococcaceae bacterium oral taxon 081]
MKKADTIINIKENCDNKNTSLEEIIEKLKKDERNKKFSKNAIPPILQIDSGAKILIIGQAPGKKVEETLIPFNDKSGDKLISWLGINKEIFYSKDIAIMPMDFYYPGKAKTGDLPPRAFIAQEYHQDIIRMMPNIKLTILIGKYSIFYYLKNKAKNNLTETVKHYKDYLPEYFPIVHPSPLNFRWQAKNPWFENEVVPKLQEIVKRILN